MLLLLISFVAGVLTVLAPCALPVLPIIIGGSISDGQNKVKKAATIIISLGVSIILFTFLLKASTLLIDIPEGTWKIISGGIILIFGIITLFPNLWKGKIAAKINTKSNMIIGQGSQKKSFWGDVAIGAALGPVFSTCSPTYFIVLATVLPVNLLLGGVYILSYVVGLGLILMLIAILGQKLVGKMGFAADPNGKFKKILGVIFIVMGLAIMVGLEKDLETKLVESNLFDVTKVEQKLLELNN